MAVRLDTRARQMRGGGLHNLILTYLDLPPSLEDLYKRQFRYEIILYLSGRDLFHEEMENSICYDQGSKSLSAQGWVSMT